MLGSSMISEFTRSAMHVADQLNKLTNEMQCNATSPVNIFNTWTG